jgi:hypothetical protein
MKRSLCINPLFTLFLVQMLYVNNEKVVSSRRYGDRGFCLVGCINSSGRVWLSYSSSLSLGVPLVSVTLVDLVVSCGGEEKKKVYK